MRGLQKKQGGGRLPSGRKYIQQKDRAGMGGVCVSEPVKLTHFNYARLSEPAGRDKHHSLLMIRGR